MVDLVGFREDNVLPVAGFYTGDVRINYLSEIVQDKSVAVREKVVDMLHVFLTKLGDRYDHQSRLLPYLLDLLTDESPTVSSVALHCLASCGKEYEDEHPNDIIEKRQYGVDGSDKINISKPLPSPFTERPRIGVRLYVRGNTKRFLSALVGELTNWQSKTRYKSAQLLRIVIVLCEEHLTIEAHTLLPSFIKAYGFSKEDKDKELSGLLLEVFELVGRYMLPDIYIYYILPRLRGDPDVVQFGIDTVTRVNVLEFLGALLSGTKPSLIPDYFEDIIAVLCDSFVIDPESSQLPASALQVIIILLQAMKGRGNVAVASNFMSTGRLTSLKRSIMSIFRFLLLTSHKDDVTIRATSVHGLQLLSEISTDASIDIGTLYHEHGSITLNDVIAVYEVSSTWHSKTPDHLLLQSLMEYPGNIVGDSSAIFEKFLLFLISTIKSASTILEECANQKDALESLARIFITVTAAICYPYYKMTPTASYSSLKEVFVKIIEGKYKGVNSSIDVVNGVAPGVVITHGENTQKKLMDIIGNNLVSLLETFVFNPVWSKSSSLQQVRVEVVGTLLGTALGSTVTCIMTDIIEPMITTDILLNNMQRIHDDVIVTGKQPSNPTSIRLATVSLIEAITIVLYRSSCYYIDDDTYNIVSYSKQSSSSAISSKCQKACGTLLPALLSCVDDSSDTVRSAVLDAFMYLIPLLEQEHFDTVSNKLISEITSATVNAEAYTQQLDSRLRSIATLDPVRFEGLLRTAIPQLLQGVHQAPSDASQMISDLLTHCEILISFQTVK